MPLKLLGVAYLEQHQGTATWLVAVQSANEAASIELSTGRPVMAMGGFSGSDPALSVAQLKELVSSGSLRYVLLGGGREGSGGSARGAGFISRGAGPTRTRGRWRPRGPRRWCGRSW